MKLEQKKISNTETLLYFPIPQPLVGSFYLDEHPILQNILATEWAKELLLTTDFLYLKSDTSEHFKDLEMLAIAELDDYVASNPKEEIAPSTNITNKINLILSIIIAPMLQRDGGNIELQTYQQGIVKVRFLGKCNGCPYAQRTLKSHVEKNLIRYIPQIKEAILI